MPWIDGDNLSPANLNNKSNLVFNVKDEDYGAVGDGVTDDTAAIIAAITAASSVSVGQSDGAVVYVPPGQYVINSQITIPTKTQLVGAGRSSTILIAGDDFPTDTPVVRLGDATDAITFGNRVEDMSIYCNNVAGSTGIYSSTINEQAGARRVLVHSYMSYGIRVEETGSGLTGVPDNFLFDDIELAPGASGKEGFSYYGTRYGGQVRRITINPVGTSSFCSYGIHVRDSAGVSGCHLTVIGANIEYHEDGLYVDSGGGATAIQLMTNSRASNTVHINSTRGVALQSIFRGNGTVTIKNDISGQSVLETFVSRYDAASSANGYQTFAVVGSNATFGHLVAASQPKFIVKSTATTGGDARVHVEMRDGNDDGWRIRYAGDGTSDPMQFFPINSGVDGAKAFEINDRGHVAVYHAFSVTSATSASYPSVASGTGYMYADSGSSLYWVNGSGVSTLLA